MYFLGWLAFFQVTCLPGFLFLHFLKIKTKTLIEKTIFIFGLSLIINFLFVFILTLLRVYQPIVVYVIFIIEIIMFLFMIVSKRSMFRVGFFTLTLIVSFLVIIRFLLPVIQNFSLKSVFLNGDAIDSWNVWASQWARNKIPLATYHYPQLIPTNWSLTYVFMQTTQIELFAKFLMPLFTLAILFIFLDLENFIGLIITGVLFHYYFDNSFLRDGYVDIAFAFFTFLPFYCGLLYQKYKQKQYLFLMLIFALGSLLTKQLGIYIVLLASISPTRWVLAQSNKIKVFKKYTFLFFFVFFLFIITVSWYFLKLPEIKTAYNPEIIYQAAMSNKLNNLSFFSRLAQSIKILVPNIKGVVIISIVTLLLLFSLKNKQSRQLLGFIVLPLFFFWSMFLNYDQRNLAVIFPYLGFVSSLAINYLALVKYLTVITSFRISIIKIIALVIPVLLFIQLLITNTKFVSFQTEGKKQIGIPELNSRLYDYYYKNGFTGKIATSYYRLCNLPEIGKYCYYSQQYNNVTMKQSGIKYLLYPKELFQPTKEGRKIIFSFRNWIFSR